MRQLFQRLYDTSMTWANRWRRVDIRQFAARTRCQYSIRHIHRSFAVLSVTGIGASSERSIGITSDPNTWRVVESVDAHAHPSVPSLRILRGCDVDSVLSSGRPVVVYVYRSDCSACECYAPIIQSVAASITAAAPRDSAVAVYAMNDATDYHPRLSALATHKLPAVAIFKPQSVEAATEAAPSIYEGTPNVSSLIRFVHSFDPTNFDIDTALTNANKSAAATARRVHDAAEKRIGEGVLSQLYANSPCGTHMLSYMTEMLAAMYSDHTHVETVSTNKPSRDNDTSTASERVDRLHRQFRECMDRQKNETLEYWQTVYVVAEDNINKLHSRR